MLVTLRGTEQRSLELEASVHWAATVTQEHGAAEIVIPRRSLAWNPDLVAEDGGSLVEIVTESGRVWRGVTERPQVTSWALRLTVYPPSQWLDMRFVQLRRVFRGCTAAIIARMALNDGLVGLGAVPVQFGTGTEAPPHIDEYVFSGQSVLQVLNDLAQLTGQEWVLDDSMRLHWRARQGRYRELVIVDDGSAFAGISGESLSDRAREVIELQDDGQRWLVPDYSTPALWPRQIVSQA